MAITVTFDPPVVAKEGTATATAAGGTAPYTYAITTVGATATIDPTTGVLTAGDVDETVEVTATDAASATGTGEIRIGAGIQLDVATVNIPADGTLTAVASKGTPPYVYTLDESGADATINASTGVLTGGGADEIVTVTVTDANESTASVEVQVGHVVKVALDTQFIESDGTATATASAGTADYVYSIAEDDAEATIVAATGVVTGGGVDEAITVVATDAKGFTASVRLYIGAAALDVAPMTYGLMKNVLDDWQANHEKKYDMFEGMRIMRGLAALSTLAAGSRPTSEYMALFMEVL